MVYVGEPMRWNVNSTDLKWIIQDEAEEKLKNACARNVTVRIDRVFALLQKTITN